MKQNNIYETVFSIKATGWGTWKSMVLYLEWEVQQEISLARQHSLQWVENKAS